MGTPLKDLPSVEMLRTRLRMHGFLAILWGVLLVGILAYGFWPRGSGGTRWHTVRWANLAIGILGLANHLWQYFHARSQLRTPGSHWSPEAPPPSP